MYGFFDENRLASNGGASSAGFIEDPMVVEKNEGSGLTHKYPLEISKVPRLYPEERKNKECNIELSELEEFLNCRSCNDNNREMVGQDMAQSYNELFHATQEPQEFISLEELGPRVSTTDHHSQNVSNSSITDHLYGGSQSDQSGGQSQQRTYYNLSTLSNSCANVYFGDISQGNNRFQAGEPLAPAATPAPPLSPTSADIHQQPSTNKNDAEIHDNDIKNSCSIINSAHTVTVSITTSISNTTNSTSTTCSATLDAKNPSNRPDGSTTNDNYVENSCGVIGESFPHTDRPNSSTMQVVQQSSVSPHHSHSHHHHHRHHHHHHHHHHHQDSTETTVCNTSPDLSDEYSPISRKRKISCHDDNDLLDDTADDVKSVRPNADSKKQNHSEIEKRRRDKMNTYITELSAMVPMCHAMSRKLDKLTVLRMAVQHLKTILGAVTSYTEGHYKPAFLSDQELKTLILQAADGFVFVVGCDRGRILYVSESVSQTLNYSQDDLLGQSWFDILHPKDVAKVKEQLSSSDLSPRERLIDAKTMLPVKTDVPQGVSRLCPGARRSFFCRMKRKIENLPTCGESQIKEEADTTPGCHRRKKQQSADWKYCVIQCTGYLKSWAPAKIGLEEPEGESDGEACNLSCLVAVGRVQPGLPIFFSNVRTPRLRTIEFVSRHALDGKFLFVDQRATLVLGFLPQELLGTSMYEYYHHDDIPHLAESHKATLQTAERVITQVYRFRTKNSSFVKLQSEWKSFKNPWTKDIEYLIAKNCAIFCDSRQVKSSVNRSEGSSIQGNYDFFSQNNGSLERLISSQVEVSKIGRRIAEEALDHQRRNEDSPSRNSPNLSHDRSLLLDTEITSPERTQDSGQSNVGGENSNMSLTNTFNHVQTNIALHNITADQVASTDENMTEIMGNAAINESPNALPSDGSDEAAMAVIMSLLEADAGLGGPVDFSGLPWPLP